MPVETLSFRGHPGIAARVGARAMRPDRFGHSIREAPSMRGLGSLRDDLIMTLEGLGDGRGLSRRQQVQARGRAPRAVPRFGAVRSFRGLGSMEDVSLVQRSLMDLSMQFNDKFLRPMRTDGTLDVSTVVALWNTALRFSSFAIPAVADIKRFLENVIDKIPVAGSWKIDRIDPATAQIAWAGVEGGACVISQSVCNALVSMRAQVFQKVEALIGDIATVLRKIKSAQGSGSKTPTGPKTAVLGPFAQKAVIDRSTLVRAEGGGKTEDNGFLVGTLAVGGGLVLLALLG